ncbi:MAG: hypothetical protein K2L99_02965 [Muribaculaceae bacterium]|nr:hypothetical protein [Muribaculaceae bacterium]
MRIRQLVWIVLAIVSTTGIVGTAQTNKEQMKERRELDKDARKQLNEKAGKDARKQAKQMEKQGWMVAPGALPLEKQLDRAYIMMQEIDYDGYPKYIMAEAMSTGGNYDAAKMQALALAKQNLAGLIETEVGALVETSVANEQMEMGDATSITRSLMESKNLINQSLGRVIPVVEAYREVNGRNREVRVQIAYSQEMARNIAKKAIKQNLEQRGDSLQGKLDSILNW